MKLVLQVQIRPDSEAAPKLAATMTRFNEAANWVAGVAFERKCANRNALQKIVYREVRTRFGLSSQTAILVVRRVCEAYKRDKTIQPVFRADAAITYDARTISFKGVASTSILTLDGRVEVKMVMGECQSERFTLSRKQVDLIRRKDGRWFLAITVEEPESTPRPVTDFIGVDLGSKNLATTDDGTNFTGAPVEKCRQRFRQLRKTCQRTGTKSAKRKLQKVRKKESRFRKDKNHCIAKAIVSKVKGTAKAIAVEDLNGIGERIPARGPDARNRMRGWAFAQLRTFITYKATLAGITVVPVDPAYTSQTCPACGHCERANRKTRDDFECKHCGHAAPADTVGAMNIRLKAIRYWVKVMSPIVGVDDSGTRKPDETTDKPDLASPAL